MQQLALFLSLLVIALLARSLSNWRSRSRKPPGPYRLPIIGNVLQMPPMHQWERFSEWAKVYGDITYVQVFGQPIAVINSAKLTNELLDKRSAIYSDRPRLLMASKLSKFDRFFGLAPYGEEWRQQRKLVSFALSKSMIPNYYPLQEAEAHKLVRSLLKKPENLSEEIQLRTGTIITRVSYGHYPTSSSDPLLSFPMRAVGNFSAAVQPGLWLVDSLPFLQYLPTWMPGTSFFKAAKRFQKESNDAVWIPYLWFKENSRTGKSLQPNMCSSILSHNPVLSRENEDTIAWAVATVLGAAFDTNISTLLSFLLLMLLHPNIQQKAQDEIDRVIGTDQLPTVKDRTRLPYVRSIITEVMRFCPVFPLGVSHSLSQDDAYENKFYLPKDTIIVPNIWGMLRDPKVFAQPDVFNPDRYDLSETEMNKVTSLVFGFGRRSCPGVHFAEATLFAFVSTILASCTICPAETANGKDVITEIKMSSGLVAFPQQFGCRLEPRSTKAMELLEQGLPLF